MFFILNGSIILNYGDRADQGRQLSSHLQALQILTKQFRLCEWDALSTWVGGSLKIIYGSCMHLITQPINALPWSKSAMKSYYY
jgi:hypothetical protein